MQPRPARRRKQQIIGPLTLGQVPDDRQYAIGPVLVTYPGDGPEPAGAPRIPRGVVGVDNDLMLKAGPGRP